MDRVDTRTDNANKSTHYEYDALGRKTKLYQGTSDTGTLLASWEYETYLGRGSPSQGAAHRGHLEPGWRLG